MLIMDPTPRQIMELYDYMEEKLNEMELTFEEFIVLYKAFRTTIPMEEQEELKKEEPAAPFPWVKYAGYGKYS